MYQIEITGQFRKDLKRIKKRSSQKLDLVRDVVKLLQTGGVSSIPERMHPHRLSGNYSGTWECHILPDLLVIWFQLDDKGVIRLIRAGTHSDLFK